LREKSIHCPVSCPSLTRHKPYQEKKIFLRKPSFVPDILQDEKLGWLALHIEAALYKSWVKDAKLADKDIVLALEYAREKIEKGQGILYLPEGDGRVKNALGETVLQEINECRYNRSIILTQFSAAYTKEEKLRCLEYLILAVKFQAGEELEGRTYLESLAARFEKLKPFSGRKKIISPT